MAEQKLSQSTQKRLEEKMSQRSAQGEVSMDKDGDSILNRSERSQQSGSKINSVNQIDGILGDPNTA